MSGHPFIFGAGAGLGGVSGSIAVAVSNATPTFGQSITITATPTGFTPTNYIFFAYDGANITWIAEQAGAAVNWTVSMVGAFEVYALGTDGALEVYGSVSLVGTSTLILDQIPVMPIWAVSLRRLTYIYKGIAALVMRSSDSMIAAIGYIGEDLDAAALVAHVGVGNGFSVQLFDQIGNNNPIQTTAAAIPAIVISGTVQTMNGKPTIVFDGTTDEMALTSDVTFVHGFVVAAKTGNVNVVQPVLAGVGQQISWGGTFDASVANISFGTPGGAIFSAVNNTTPHQVSFKMGAAGTAELMVDGVATTGTTSPTMTINRIGVRPDLSTLRNVGRFSEAICYAAALSNADRNILNANQKAYWGTP